MSDTDKLFLITGATGNTGAHTVRLLRERGQRVRALVHRVDERADRLRDLGAEVVQGDLLDFPSVSAATVGVSGAYFNYPVAPGLIEATANFVQAASEADVRSVVNMSQISARREAKSNAARHHWIAERLLDRSALMTTHLRPTFFTFFMNMFWVRENDEGVYRLPFADGRHAPIDAADQAHVIAAILQNPEPHDRQIYQLSGAEDLDWYEISAKVEATLGIPVRYQPMDIAAFAADMAEAGASPHFVQHFSNVAQDYRDGVFAGANNLVEVIGGVKPITVEDYVESTRSLFATSGRPRR
ncbi:NmrA family transcriptional regulator [Mycobacterium sp. 852013-50091_SCH5140682]|uniref:NmrA family NAD(P)-binding protein n=1 Tax=Mycobacterium sp. 852013-50091_SCH5140682 TaxID=1834109 RepID=UPI0007EA879A|nr:NmrA family NAD(P)-binding protein [Mycobacterium sp. 852013-50091_SCH5140682]OBC15065.1 NmrA family transcriptional regulator [Mycobacterium sp. 852013-50091_SCH5140682]